MMERGGLAYALLASSGKKTVRQAGSHEKQPRETHQHPPRLYHVGIVLGTTGLFFPHLATNYCSEYNGQMASRMM